jgi:hypothetical protein
MQQVNQTGLRLGSATGWQMTRHEKANQNLGLRYVDVTRKALAKRGLFCLNNYVYNHRGVMIHSVVYYRYLQRSRINKWLVRRLRRREGALAPWPVRYRMFYQLDVSSTKSVFNSRAGIKKAFPLAVQQSAKRPRIAPNLWHKMSQDERDKYNAQFTQKAAAGSQSGLAIYETPRQRTIRMKNSKRIRGWMDLEWKLHNIYKLGQTDSLNWQLRAIYDRMLGGRSEVLLYNVMQFVPSLNPIVTSRYYIFKRFSNLLYQADLIQATYLAINFNMSRVLANVIVMGLERHAAKRKQRMFLKMVEATIARLTTWDALKSKPFNMRISVYGKLDAQMRRIHVLMRCGHTQYQQVNFLTSSSKQVSVTKFGTSNVQIWMRNVSEWKQSS